MNDEEYLESCLRELRESHTDDEAREILKKFSYLYTNPLTNKGRPPVKKAGQTKKWAKFQYYDRQKARDTGWRYDEEIDTWWKYQPEENIAEEIANKYWKRNQKLYQK
jgi:hypothetical protein